MVRSDIYDSLSEMLVCCETVRDAYRCSDCPIIKTCLEESTFECVATRIKAEDITRLIAMADRLTEEAEEQGKTDEQRRWEAEADYWNDRRCDPDDYE